jgi:hypothetical protein
MMSNGELLYYNHAAGDIFQKFGIFKRQFKAYESSYMHR